MFLPKLFLTSLVLVSPLSMANSNEYQISNGPIRIMNGKEVVCVISPQGKGEALIETFNNFKIDATSSYGIKFIEICPNANKADAGKLRIEEGVQRSAEIQPMEIVNEESAAIRD